MHRTRGAGGLAVVLGGVPAEMLAAQVQVLLAGATSWPLGPGSWRWR